MTLRERTEELDFCGEPGISVWTNKGNLIATMCLKTKGHADSHEQLWVPGSEGDEREEEQFEPTYSEVARCR